MKWCLNNSLIKGCLRNHTQWYWRSKILFCCHLLPLATTIRHKRIKPSLSISNKAMFNNTRLSQYTKTRIRQYWTKKYNNSKGKSSNPAVMYLSLKTRPKFPNKKTFSNTKYKKPSRKSTKKNNSIKAKSYLSQQHWRVLLVKICV